MQNQWLRIPLELRSLKQWVAVDIKKFPFNPKSKNIANVNDPTTWGSFEEAANSGFPSIGFVLTTNDPFTIIDLDNKPTAPCTAEQWERHLKILNTVASYTEKSVSGYGYHIIAKGKIPQGRKRDNVEIYSQGRYMICTGNVVWDTPVRECQELLTTLYNEMTTHTVDSLALNDSPEILNDEEIYEMAVNAENGEKFIKLVEGDWQGLGYPSQSEADFALLSILSFYSKNNEQVKRLFRFTNLGKREKAVKNDAYLNRAITKIRSRDPQTNFEKFELPVVTPVTTPPVQKSTITFPPGLTGEIAEYIFNTAIRPVPEIALGAAITFMSGLCGRSYNISGSGLNQYLVILAKTGSGKEGAATGIDNIVSSLRPTIPMIDQFIGPSAFASGQALIKVLNDKPCFVSILGEFGLTLQQLCDPRATSSEIMLKKVLLDLYSKSGWAKVLRSSVYSDVEKNTKAIQSPNVTILGESTPEAFFDGLDIAHIAEGLIPRFSIIEYTGARPERNKGANFPPCENLKQKLSDLVTVCLLTTSNNACTNIHISDEALVLLDDFDQKADRIMNGSSNDVTLQLWNRAHLKALKLSGLLAVGINVHTPLVTPDLAKWAIEFVERDIAVILARFDRGEVGQGDHRLELDIRRCIEDYLAMSTVQRNRYKVPQSIQTENIIPFHYIRRRVRLLSGFKADKRGAVRALTETLDDMVKAEILLLLSPLQTKARFGLTTPLYAPGPTW